MKLPNEPVHHHFVWTHILERLRIYTQLMRADKPIGTLLLLWPTLWALWIAGKGQPDIVLVVLFVMGTFLMRSAGCVINDFADRHFDGEVERTKNRPFALKKVSKKEAVILTVVLCLFAALCLLPMNQLTWLLSIPAVFLALTYPYTKRFFPIPQFYLGLAFSFGIPMAFAAITNHIPLVAWVLFIANTCWTLAYDTIYAMADKEDDLKIGIKTSAITFGRFDTVAAILCYLCFDLMMIWVGLLINANGFYWCFLPVVMIFQWYYCHLIRSRNREICFKVFLANNKMGVFWFLALIGNYL